MLEISLIDVIGRIIPEGLFFVWAFFILSQTKIQIKRYFISVIIVVALVCVVRFLPIHFGVHTLLIIIGDIFINIEINKISTIKSIVVTFTVIIIEFICEILDLVMLQYLFKVDIAYVFSNSQLKVLYALPSFVFFIFFIFLLKFLMDKRERNKL